MNVQKSGQNFSLPELRRRIDEIDRALISLLAQRFRWTHQVGLLKKAQGVPPIDQAREAEQFERVKTLAEDSGLSPELAAKFFRLLIDEVVECHRRV